MIVISEEDILKIKARYDPLSSLLTERSRRVWAATEARSYGIGGVTAVHRATSISRNTIYSGLREIELDECDKLSSDRSRRSGAGRTSIVEKDKDIEKELEKLVDPYSRGDPESPLKWTCKSVRKLSDELKKKDYDISFRSVATLLKNIGYSLQGNKKVLEGTNHLDSNAQFEYINNKSTEFLEKGQAVLSVDTKKKENIGNFKNNGQEYSKKGQPIKVSSHDFPNKELGKVSPYGAYDIGSNKGWVSVGISADTAEFAVNTIRSWWYNMGNKLYQNSGKIMITADCGGSNGYRTRLWKVELQKLANEINKEIHVSHFPPGTSKWNKIEHRMFSYISQNWRGKPLVTKEVVVNLIANTTTKAGLKIMAMLDENTYQKGIKVADEELNQVNIIKDDFHGEWNYKILPQK